jgi:hypothetical protein
MLKFIEVSRQHCVFSRVDKELGEAVTIYLNRSRRSTRFKVVPPDCCANHATCTHEILRAVDRQEREGRIQVPPYDFAAVKYVLGNKQ